MEQEDIYLKIISSDRKIGSFLESMMANYYSSDIIASICDCAVHLDDIENHTTTEGNQYSDLSADECVAEMKRLTKICMDQVLDEHFKNIKEYYATKN